MVQVPDVLPSTGEFADHLADSLLSGARGIGLIPQSGWRLGPDYAAYDAEQRFEVLDIVTEESPLCHSGEVLQGLLKPNECPAFGKQCTPRSPLIQSAGVSFDRGSR